MKSTHNQPKVIAKALPLELEIDTERITRVLEGLALIILSLLISA